MTLDIDERFDKDGIDSPGRLEEIILKRQPGLSFSRGYCSLQMSLC